MPCCVATGLRRRLHVHEITLAVSLSWYYVASGFARLLRPGCQHHSPTYMSRVYSLLPPSFNVVSYLIVLFSVLFCHFSRRCRRSACCAPSYGERSGGTHRLKNTSTCSCPFHRSTRKPSFRSSSVRDLLIVLHGGWLCHRRDAGAGSRMSRAISLW